MSFLSRSERVFLHAVSQLIYCNPFLPERIACERAALGSDYVEGEPVWSLPVDQPERPRANVWRIVERLDPLAGDDSQKLLPWRGISLRFGARQTSGALAKSTL